MTRVSLNESEDDSLDAMMEAFIDSAETPNWSGNAQATSLTNTLTTLTLAGVPVTNTILEDGVEKGLLQSRQPHKELKLNLP